MTTSISSEASKNYKKQSVEKLKDKKETKIHGWKNGQREIEYIW